jgi:cyclic pyranopterin phosphate synthase
MAALPQLAATPANLLWDSHNRVITDLRVSITDRCNYKCVYCRTGEVGAQYAELSTEDYLRLIRNFVALGIEKVRLTGGEPLLRRDLVEMVRELATWRTPAHQPLDLAITTNGHLLEDLAAPLKTAGLSRITVSMDAVEQTTFERVTRVPGSFPAVIRGIRAAQEAGLGKVKVNCVLLRGFNDDQIEGFAHFARSEGVIVRFIEFMPLEEGRLWSPEMVVPVREILDRICAVFPLRPLAPTLQEKPPAGMDLMTGRVKSASSRPSLRPSAALAAASGSPQTAKSAPVCFPMSSMTFTATCVLELQTKSCVISSPPRWREKKPATTSANLGF